MRRRPEDPPPVTPAIEEVISTLLRPDASSRLRQARTICNGATRVGGENAQKVLLGAAVEIGVLWHMLGGAGVVDQGVELAVGRGGSGDLGATLGRTNGDGRAKTRPAACHQDHLAVELARHPLPSGVADRLAFTSSRCACVTSLPSRRPSL